MLAASGEKSAEMAGEISDGFINTAPDADVVKKFEKSGGKGKPKYGKVNVCWAKSEKEARATAYRYWPTSGLKGNLAQELPLPSQFEDAAKMVTEDDVAERITCGNDVEKHLQAIQKYIEAGYDHIYIHQIGQDQEGFFKFYRDSVLPELRLEKAAMR
jgi:G6PDH family F420-dependent oxidoreductase